MEFFYRRQERNIVFYYRIVTKIKFASLIVINEEKFKINIIF